ncbi:MAG TPA: hypothetical protein VIV55_09855 [Flavobacterium sp.]
MKKFEYMEDIDLGLEQINLLGKEGWELVSVVIEPGEAREDPSIYSFYFKREIK